MHKYRYTHFINTKGQTVLSLVLLTAAIGIISLMIAQQLGRRQSGQIRQIEQIDQTYYATEGAMYETLEHLTSNPAWPGMLTYNDSYTLNGVTISRTIISTTNGSGEEVREVTINGNYEGISRKVVGTDIAFESGGRVPLDLMLAMDLSGSMWDTQVSGEYQPIGATKDAAITFVGLLDNGSGGVIDRGGLIGWGSNCQPDCLTDWLYHDLKPDSPGGEFQNLINRINAINSNNTSGNEGGTAMDTAIEFAGDYMKSYIESNPPADINNTIPAIILLSDGLSNHPRDCCGPDSDTDPNSLDEPIASSTVGPWNVCQWVETNYGDLQNGVQSGNIAGRNAIWMLPSNPNATASYDFIIPGAGIYEARGITRSTSRNSSSFFIRFDTQSPKIWNNNNYNSTWIDQSDNIPFYVNSGTHTVTLSYSEPNFPIDKILVQPACGKQAAIDAASAIDSLTIDLGVRTITGIPIYTIGLGPFADAYTLSNVAAATGAQYYYAPTTAELDQIFASIVNDLRNNLASYNLNEEIP
ncbi:VWA domain-containing protein [candidate division WWE3 bacterium]|uniref:VWA domain-containing protein n=1 Tax=candidate division WWE3 bacterium TaxID=2053526 RepID=A0A955RPE3_UNCKA|nr:VWA domain-containing protein [candidate division WWE3 bacterium]